MAANYLLTSSNVDDTIQTKIANEAMGQLIEQATMPKLVNVTFSEAIKAKGQTVDIPKLGAILVKDKTAGQNYDKQTTDTTKVSVTLNKHKHITIGEEDVAQSFSEIDILAGYVSESVSMLANQVDADLIALFSGFTTNTVDATSAWGRTQVKAAQTLLRKNGKVPHSMEKYLVCAPDALNALTNQDNVANVDESGLTDISVDGYASKRFGALLFDDANIAASGGSPSTYTNLLFVRNAMSLATSNMKITTAPNVYQAMLRDPISGLSMRYTFYYDVDGGGDTFRVELLYGVAEVRDEYAVKITTAA